MKLIKDLLPEIFGVLFSIVALTLGYLLITFVIDSLSSDSYKEAVNQPLGLIPISVFAAIILFICKEVVEFFRRKKANFRKVSAIKILLSEEIQLNYWVWLQMKSLINTVKDKTATSTFNIVLSSSGAERFEESRADGSSGGQAFPKISENIYQKVILEIAELDANLYSFLKNYHLKISELQHLRNGVYDYVDENGKELMWQDGYVSYSEDQLPLIKECMSSLFLQCSGKKLEKPRIR